MRTIARLFGKSPFAPLQQHMEKVAACIKKIEEIFNVFFQHSELSELESLVVSLSKMEHEADLTKNDIRNHLPRSLFLPVDRGQILEMLAIQDSIADQAEDIGLSLTLYPLQVPSGMENEIRQFFQKNIEAFWDAKNIMNEIDPLLESSFGGIEAEKVKAMVEQTSYKEYEADLHSHRLLKQFFSRVNEIDNPSFYLWLRLVEEIGSISHISERLANRIRMVLELK